MPTCTKCGDPFPMFILINGRRRNLQRRTYCLTCSPFGNHNTKKLVRAEQLSTHTCTLCGEPCDPRRTRCGSCEVKIRRYRIKLAAIALLGGKCARCGFDGSQVAFDFHHIGKGNKDFSIAAAGTIAWDRLRVELEKCELLCSNCHRIEHSDDNPELLRIAKDYHGSLDLGLEDMPL